MFPKALRGLAMHDAVKLRRAVLAPTAGHRPKVRTTRKLKFEAPARCQLGMTAPRGQMFVGGTS